MHTRDAVRRSQTERATHQPVGGRPQQYRCVAGGPERSGTAGDGRRRAVDGQSWARLHAHRLWGSFHPGMLHDPGWRAAAHEAANRPFAICGTCSGCYRLWGVSLGLGSLALRFGFSTRTHATARRRDPPDASWLGRVALAAAGPIYVLHTIRLFIYISPGRGLRRPVTVNSSPATAPDLHPQHSASCAADFAMCVHSHYVTWWSPILPRVLPSSSTRER